MAHFRTLAFVDTNRGASLSEAAGHIGLSLPSMSRLVDRLVNQEFLTGSAHGVDRRRIFLRLTPSGKRELDDAYRHAESFFAGKFAELTSEQRSQLAESITTLKRLFMLAPEGHS
jgi:DNA-binding MarR family transcriptional regulator